MGDSERGMRMRDKGMDEKKGGDSGKGKERKVKN